MTHATWALQSHDLSREGIHFGTHNTFLTTQGYGGPPGWGINSMPRPPPRQHEHKRRYTPFTLTRRIWMDDRPNDMPKVSWHLKTPVKPHQENLSRPGLEPVPAAWQTRMLTSAPQRWTFLQTNGLIELKFCILSFQNVEYTVLKWWKFGSQHDRLKIQQNRLQCLLNEIKAIIQDFQC